MGYQVLLIFEEFADPGKISIILKLIPLIPEEVCSTNFLDTIKGRVRFKNDIFQISRLKLLELRMKTPSLKGKRMLL